MFMNTINKKSASYSLWLWADTQRLPIIDLVSIAVRGTLMIIFECYRWLFFNFLKFKIGVGAR